MKTILITGTNRGIGLELTKQYAQANWQVFACCRNPDAAKELQQLAEQSNQQITILPLDTADVSSMLTLKKSLGNTAIDVLINNAGILGKMGRETFGTLHDHTDEALKIFQVNSLGPLFLSEVLVDNVTNSQLKTIANISSDWASIALNKDGIACLYRASKAALNSITASMAAALKEKYIKVIAIHPGWVQTDMGGPSAVNTPEESAKGIMQQIEKLDIANTGCYVRHTGETLPW
jgi:NAD(P)-dependent dehydrogenase (short-subunit alcohol dehydrogenase family)